MKARLVLAALVLGWVCLGAWSAEAGAGELVITPSKIEFGAIREGVVAEKTVSMKNVGQESIVIRNVSTS